MNLGSKVKKRVVLPSRPEPPSVEQILEDVRSSAADDPLFSLLDQTFSGSGPSAGSGTSAGDGEVELRFQQCKRFMELNQQLTEAQDRLRAQRDELRTTATRLQRDIQDVRGQAQHHTTG